MGTPKGATVGYHMPHLCLRSHPMAYACSPVIMPRGGRGSGPGSTHGACGRLPWLTCWVTNLQRFHQKRSKTVKTGVPPVFDPFSGTYRLNRHPPTLYGPQMAKSSIWCPPKCSILSRLDIFSRWGVYQVGVKFKKHPLGRGVHT